MLEDGSVIPAIIEKRKALSPQHALLVGISGIDASGKGFVTTRIAESLQKRGIKLAVISADGWLNLPHVRFHQQDLAKHFYESAIRFDEMFEGVILPLRGTRNVNVESDCSWRGQHFQRSAPASPMKKLKSSWRQNISPTCPTVLLKTTLKRQSSDTHRSVVYFGFEFHKRSQLFIPTHNETLSVVAMCVCDPDRLPVGVNR